MYYLDHTATTDVHPEVRDAMVRAMDIFANPSSLHTLGLEAEHLVRDARAMLAAELGVSERNVIFTSGGTESNNLAIFGARGHRTLAFERGRDDHGRRGP